MDCNDFRERVLAERKTFEQRDAAERKIPGERLRRELREAAVRDDMRKHVEEGHWADPEQDTDQAD